MKWMTIVTRGGSRSGGRLRRRSPDRFERAFKGGGGGVTLIVGGGLMTEGVDVIFKLKSRLDSP